MLPNSNIITPFQTLDDMLVILGLGLIAEVSPIATPSHNGWRGFYLPPAISSGTTYIHTLPGLSACLPNYSDSRLQG